MNIGELFNKLQNHVRKKRRTTANFDGLKYWHSFKPILQKSSFKGKWKKMPEKLVQRFMSQPEYVIDGYGNQHIIEDNHFLIQTVRIPTNEEPSLRKIMQVALNVGQYRAKTQKISMKRVECSDYVYRDVVNTTVADVLDQKDMKSMLRLLSK